MDNVTDITQLLQKLESTNSLQTSNTQDAISKLANEAPVGFADEEIDKTNVFFGRLATVYGKGRTRTLWGESEERLTLMRREWAHQIGALTFEEIDETFERLKQKLSSGDPDYRWPDVPRILNLINEGKVRSSHTPLPRSLPEPEWRKQQRIELGRLASKTCLAVMNGKASFLEDKPNDQ